MTTYRVVVFGAFAVSMAWVIREPYFTLGMGTMFALLLILALWEDICGWFAGRAWPKPLWLTMPGVHWAKVAETYKEGSGSVFGVAWGHWFIGVQRWRAK